MTNQHPMLPKQKQLDVWNSEYYDGASLFDEVTTQAFQWGADCQLEQVIEYLENDLEFVLWGWSEDFMDKFKKAMRPQEDNQ